MTIQFANPIFLLLMIIAPLLMWRLADLANAPPSVIPSVASCPLCRRVVPAQPVGAAPSCGRWHLCCWRSPWRGRARPTCTRASTPRASPSSCWWMSAAAWHARFRLARRIDQPARCREARLPPVRRRRRGPDATPDGGDARLFQGRPTDSIGLVVFATRPLTVCPLTLSHSVLLRLLDDEKPRSVPGESETNISDAVALGLQRLQSAGPRRKVLVLLTDGEHNVPNPRSELDAATGGADRGQSRRADLHHRRGRRGGGGVSEGDAATVRRWCASAPSRRCRTWRRSRMASITGPATRRAARRLPLHRPSGTDGRGELSVSSLS